MTDIVERAHDFVANHSVNPADSLIVEMADGIERLRERVASLSASYANVASLKYSELEEEIERLKAALRMGIELCESGGHGKGEACPTCHFMREAQRVLNG